MQTIVESGSCATGACVRTPDGDGGVLVYSISIARARVKIGMMNVVYTLRRAPIGSKVGAERAGDRKFAPCGANPSGMLSVYLVAAERVIRRLFSGLCASVATSVRAGAAENGTIQASL